MTAILTPGATIHSNMTSDSAQKMSVDMSGLAHIISVLTNLYSNPSLAVLREYSVNALDAHVEAGTERPIEVTLPSEFNPTLTIKDYGVGMTEADIYCIYSQYGASTKRDDETQVGGFGLGSKSALALTQQFTVTAVKNGRKTVVHFAQGSDGVGVVDTLLRASTDEPNGVEISIPVTDAATMVREAQGFFSVWKPGTVLVNGQEPENIWDSAIKVSEGVYLLDNEAMTRCGMRSHYGAIVMGSVPYPMDMTNMQQITRAINPRFPNYTERLLIEVGIGEVEITPSREALNYSARTHEALSRRMQGFFDNIATVASKQVEDANTPSEAAQRALFWRSKGWLGALDLKWNDREVPANLTFETPVSIIQFGEGQRTTTDRAKTSLPMSGLNRFSYVISGIDTEEKAVRASRDIRDYIRFVENGRTPQNGIAIYAPLGAALDSNPWLHDDRDGLFTQVTIDEVMEGARAYRRSRRAQRETTRGAAQTTMQYPVLDTTPGVTRRVSNRSVADILSSKQRIFYYESSTARFSVDHLSSEPARSFFMSLLPENSLMIVVEGNRTRSGLLRRIPQAVPVKTLYAQAAKKFVNSLSETERRLVATNSWEIARANRILRGLRHCERQITNKAFLDLMNSLSEYGIHNGRYEALQRMYRAFERYSAMDRDAYAGIIAPAFSERHNLLADYPLLPESLFPEQQDFFTVADHVVTYLNALG